MRHRKKFNHLGRTAPHRKAMLANMASSLIIHKRITTTTAKAKALRSFVEPVITGSKEDSTHSRRMAFKHLRDKHAVSELFRDVAAKIGERPGGYTRIIKLGNRPGDNADMCIIELVDYNENLLAEKAAAKTKASRRRRGGKKKTDGTETVQAPGLPDTGEEATETAEGVAATETAAEAADRAAEAAEEVTEEATEAVEEAAEEVAEAAEEVVEAAAEEVEAAAEEVAESIESRPEASTEDPALSEEKTNEETDDKEEKKEE